MQLEMPVRDRDTVIRRPHDAIATRKAGVTTRAVHDPRTSVAMQEEGATVTLFFDPEAALAGDAEVLEIRLTPAQTGDFEPWRLMPRLPLYLQYARASLAWEHDDAAAALRALRKAGSTRRGLSDDFLRIVAQEYSALVEAGERYPIKALAAAQHADKSTASRWVSAARARGFLNSEGKAQR